VASPEIKQSIGDNMTANPKFTYTLVGYREEGSSSCRGCTMERSSSEFFLTVCFTADEVAAEWARRLFSEEGLGREYCEFDYTLLLNGLDEHNDPDKREDESACNPETGYGYAEEARSAIAARVKELVAQLKADKLAAEELAKKQLAAQEIGRRERQRIEQEAAERAEYARLQAKFQDS
jgi:hypothetical protein